MGSNRPINNNTNFNGNNTVNSNNLRNNYNSNNIQKYNNNNNINYYNNNNNINDNDIEERNQNIISNLNQNQQSIQLNIEDLMVLEEKLSEIISSLKGRQKVENQCFDFWNYYYNCSLYQKLEKVFKEQEDSDIVSLSINYELMSVMVCYEFSFDKDVLNKAYILLLELLKLNYKNLMLICEEILNKISPENRYNIWVNKLKEIVESSKQSDSNSNKSTNKNYYYRQQEEIDTPVDKINNNTNIILKKLRNILMNYKTEYSGLLVSLLKKIDQKDYEEINDFFREYILRVENFEGSLVASVFLKENPYFQPVPPPYLKTPRTKKYTLILDLDETLVNFKQTTEKQGFVRIRPFLFVFLEDVSQYYELILFTSATQDYADSIINAIEYENKYFDHIFYRQHTIIIGNDFVKDLTRIGRPLDSTIIIDNMPQNFRLQKENGITIKPFWGQDSNDTALYDLIPILIDIAEEECDVRTGLAKYRDEIVKKITSNISKHNI